MVAWLLGTESGSSARVAFLPLRYLFLQLWISHSFRPVKWASYTSTKIVLCHKYNNGKKNVLNKGLCNLKVLVLYPLSLILSWFLN